MGFLSPWFLGGALAAAVPLYVHLLKQHKTVPVQFSSLMFFEKRTQSSIKHRRLKYIALLLLRLAIVLLLALLFANPFVNRSAKAAGQGKKLQVVAVDNSFSMRAEGRLEKAKQEALSALSGFRPGDVGQVLTFASHANLLTQPVESLAELQAAVASIKPGDGRSAYGEISRLLRSLAASSSIPVEAHIISDMQRSSLPSPFAELALLPNTKLVLHQVTETRMPNLYVESVNAPRSVFQAKKVRVQATLGGSGGETTASIALGGKVLESKKVIVPANGRVSVEFYLPDAAYGFNRGEVRIDGKDVLPQDDLFSFALERKEASRVLFVHEARQPRAVQYVRAALEATPDSGFSVEAVSSEAAANLALEKYSFVVLSDLSALPPSLDASLQAFVKRGGSVFVALGSFSAARSKVPIAALSIQGDRYSSRAGERFQAVGAVDETHPAVGKAGRFENVKFYQAVRVEPGDARVLARLTDGTPLLLEKKVGAGRAMVFTSTLDNIANDFPLHASFIPFVDQASVYLSGVEPAPAHYPVDSFLELRSARDTGSNVEVIGPGGQRLLSLKEAASAQAYRFTGEGFYEVRRGNGRNELVAVHADRRESDLDVIPKETLALWQNAGLPDSQSGPVGSESKPYSLWWYFALALFLVALLESLFASRYLTTDQRESRELRKAA